MRIAEAVNHHFSASPSIAHADNSGLVSIAVPPAFSARGAEFVAELESLTVETDRPAKVVINERTGTIVMGKEVRVSPVAIMHGSLTVEIQTAFNVSPSRIRCRQGTTDGSPASQCRSQGREGAQRGPQARRHGGGTGARAQFYPLGPTPRDIIAILQALRSAGALESEIEVI